MEKLWEILGMVPWGVWVLVVVGFVVAVLVTNRTTSYRSGSELSAAEREISDAWAERKDLRGLLSREKDGRRLTLGYYKGQRVCSPPLASMMVIAPTGSGKTASIVVPAVLSHQGPAVVASVKSDVKVLTENWRRQMGPVWVFDPSRTGGDTARWSPLATVHNWADALEAARWIQNSSKVEKSGLEDREFWDSNARKVLAPLLLLSARHGGSMATVVEWAARIRNMESQLGQAIAGMKVPAAENYWLSYVGLAEKTKSSVDGTLFTVLEAWSHPRVAEAVSVAAGSDDENSEDVVNIDALVAKGGTLYLVAPAAQQELFTPVFETLVNAVLMAIERLAQANSGTPVDPPLLLCLDEAANIAPIRNLDRVASKGRGEGVVTVSVWQDEGQAGRIYGRDKARTVYANHTCKVFLPGISDDETLERLSRLIGQTTVERVNHSTDGVSRSQISTHHQEIVVAPPSWLRQLPPNEAVVIAGSTKPMRLQERPWYVDREMRERIPREVQDRFDNYFAPRKKARG